MEQRGRKSAAALSVISGDGITSIGRPDPLPGLTARQVQVWREVVNRLPADWFPAETLPLLAQYCRHVVEAERLALMIDQLTEKGQFDLGDYDLLLRMHEREGRAASSLATRMRLTQQATYSARKSTGRPKGRKPWDVEG